MILSFYFLSTAVKSIPIGTAYAIWTGIGAVGTAILGIILFGESKEFIRIFFIFLIVIGIVGLKIFSKIPIQLKNEDSQMKIKYFMKIISHLLINLNLMISCSPSTQFANLYVDEAYKGMQIKKVFGCRNG